MTGNNVKTPGIFRIFTIIGVAGQYLVLYKFTSFKKRSFGKRLCQVCEKLGPVFVKLGQILSTRYDLLDRDDCNDLQKLLDTVEPFSFEKAVKIFQSDFGKGPENLYKEFPKTPIASASIAQVYRAVTKNGKTVAVKIRRPEIIKTLKSDINILKNLVRFAQLFSSDLRHVRATKILDQLESWILNEADFHQEMNNLTTLTYFYSKRAKKGDNYAAALVFPKLYPELCSRNVITMEFLEGIPANKFNSKIAGPKYDAYASIVAALGSSVRAWLDCQPLVFHADPHPANILIMKDGKVGLLDFGLMGSFSKKDAEEICEMMLAVYTQNMEQTIYHAFILCQAPSSLDTPELRRDVGKYLEKTKGSGLGFWFMGYIRLFVKHRIPLPYQLVLFGRGNVIVDGLFETVAPGKTTIEVMGDELRNGLYRNILRNITETDVGPILYVLSKKIKESPATIAQFIDKYANQPLEFIKEVKKILES